MCDVSIRHVKFIKPAASGLKWSLDQLRSWMCMVHVDLLATSSRARGRLSRDVEQFQHIIITKLEKLSQQRIN